jgi:choline dehydrogenase-like flavoprotein
MQSQFGRGLDWPITYDDLEPWYCLAESELGVAGNHGEWNGFHGARRSKPFPQPAVPQTFGDTSFKRANGLTIDGVAVKVRATPQARSSDCFGAASCIPICPTGAKYEGTKHLVRLKPDDVHYATVATRLLIESGKVVGARAVSWGSGVPAEVVYRARRVVVACHSIESARLLLASGVEDRSGMIGCNLMDHPTGQLAGLSPEPWFPLRGPPVTSGIDEWRDGAFRCERSGWKLSLGNDGLGRFRRPEQRVGDWLDAGLFGASLERVARDEATRWFRISWATEQLPNPANRMTLTGAKDALGVPQVQLAYDVDNYTFSSYPWIRSVIRRLFREVKVSELPVPDPGPGRETYGGSGHVMGTTRMGNDAEHSVVDPHCRLHLHHEVWVVGSSVFPTGSTANPTLTVAALALRAASDLLSELG